MNLPSVLMADLTNEEVEAFLAEGNELVLVPTGSTEQHGPHAPLGTDVIIPSEVTRRVAVRRAGRCLVAPAVPYGLSSGHRGFKGLAYLNPPAFLAVIEDIVCSLAESGFRQIVFVNGHYTNEPAINLACLNVHPRLPAGTRAWAVSYWNAMPPEERDAYLGLEAGLHANVGETSCVMAVRPELVHLDRADAEWPDFSAIEAPVMPVIFAYFETRPGSVHQAFRRGTWGDPSGSSAELGERYLEQAARAVDRLIADVERTYRDLDVRR